MMASSKDNSLNSSNLIRVRWKSDFSLNKGKNCLGKDFLDKGHSLDPDPPESIRGIIFFFRHWALNKIL